MAAPGEVAGNHRDNGLRESIIEIVPLDHQRWTTFGRAQIRIRKEHQNNFTAPGCHKRRLRVVPNLR